MKYNSIKANKVIIAENGNINIQQAATIQNTEKGDIIIQQQAATIQNTTGLSDEKLDQLFAALKELVKNESMDKTVRDELRTTIATVEKADKTKWWQHIQSFLNNSANLAALVSLGLQIATYL